ncbi:hypothetical protein HGH92_23730 [Chitinophaga varians]|uniref:3-keto-disaccharide hydrolase domain-containing protein n=1 Tax=Chitinophaga varians TaxID=2202339 RepID=A0A847RWY9_9BACT|nr:hypothetical protein [Chitinophaga varians]NLR67336.1 hypothetical protein [Chitinophaga varians]
MKYTPIFAVVFLVAAIFASCKKDNVKSRETVLYEADFSSEDGHWSVGALGSAGAMATISNGYYTLVAGSQGRDVWTWAVFSGVDGGTAVEASVKLSTTGSSSDGSGGLIWGSKENNNSNVRYYFGISYDGYYTIWGYPNGTDKPFVVYKDWVSNSAIRNSDFNTLRITLVNGSLHFYINTQEVFNMPSTGGSLDKSGFAVSKNSTLQADYFKAVKLD